MSRLKRDYLKKKKKGLVVLVLIHRRILNSRTDLILLSEIPYLYTGTIGSLCTQRWVEKPNEGGWINFLCFSRSFGLFIKVADRKNENYYKRPTFTTIFDN